MGYLAVWKVLEKMITDFRKRGVAVPADIVSKMRSAKTLINVLKADPSRKDTDQKVEEHLVGVESYLVSEGEKRFGSEYTERWFRRLEEAGEKVLEEEGWKTRFIPGIPRNQKWIRIKPSDELPIEEVKALTGELNLSCKVQEDGYLLVYGKKEGIKDFVKEMTKKYGFKTRKQREKL